MPPGPWKGTWKSDSRRLAIGFWLRGPSYSLPRAESWGPGSPSGLPSCHFCSKACHCLSLIGEFLHPVSKRCFSSNLLLSVPRQLNESLTGHFGRKHCVVSYVSESCSDKLVPFPTS